MELKNYYGVIISRRSRIGTRSKGPEYHIKLEESNEFGQTELSIRKEAHLWEEDPVLQRHVGNKAQIKGEPVFTKHVKFKGKIKSEDIIY
ncbi:MAG: hypothetical protein ACFFB6_10385 [Promethearchaeota archaeon]